jgi:cellulose biosynthesis protein BcsQ
MGFDDQPAIDRMFALQPGPPGTTLLEALRAGTLDQAIRLGQYGVHYVPTSARVGELKSEINRPGFLQSVLRASGWRGLVVLDTKGDLEILTKNAIAASDLSLVVAKDFASILEAQKVFDLLREWDRPLDRARVVLSMMDRRIKYVAGSQRDVLGLLLEEARSRGLPLLETFISVSPKVESLATNPDHALRTILHGAPHSLVHRQLRGLTEDVLQLLFPTGIVPEAPRSASLEGSPEARPASLEGSPEARPASVEESPGLAPLASAGGSPKARPLPIEGSPEARRGSGTLEAELPPAPPASGS